MLISLFFNLKKNPYNNEFSIFSENWKMLINKFFYLKKYTYTNVFSIFIENSENSFSF